MKSDLIFCSVVFPKKASEVNALMLVESIRAFGGKYSHHQVWLGVAGNSEYLDEGIRKRLLDLDVRFVPFKITQKPGKLFFSDELMGLEVLETAADKQCECLAWMDTNTILLNEPIDMLLPEGKMLGYRPVHHLLIGSRFDEPPDDFWRLIYENCQVKPDRIFAMRPVVQTVQMRAYFNAGLLVVRPERGLLRQWRQDLTRLMAVPDFQSFYKSDKRYSIFMHQAVLSATILRMFEHQEMIELPAAYNYPIHLYDQDETSGRPASVDSLVTIRHEGLYQAIDGQADLPFSMGLRQWLVKRLIEIRI